MKSLTLHTYGCPMASLKGLTDLLLTYFIKIKGKISVYEEKTHHKFSKHWWKLLTHQHVRNEKILAVETKFALL